MTTTNCHSVVLLGDWGVGKSSLLNAHITDVPQTKGISSTIGTSFCTLRPATSQMRMSVCCWDTAGQERYKALLPMYTRNASAYICVVASSRQPAVEVIDDLIMSIIQHNEAPDLCHIAVVHSKCDIGHDIIPELNGLIERIKDALTETGQSVNISVHESSALKPSTCHPVFDACIRSIDERLQHQQKNDVLIQLLDTPPVKLKKSHWCC